MAYADFVKFETLFDEDEVTDLGKRAFKEEALSQLRLRERDFEVLEEDNEGYTVQTGSEQESLKKNLDLAVTKIGIKYVDPEESQGYKKFASVKEYQDWLKASLHQPTQEEMEEAINAPRS